MKKVILLSSFFIISPLFILSVALYLAFLSYSTPTHAEKKTHSVAYADVKAESFETKLSQREDSRVEIVRRFFEKYNSPLVPHAEDVVRTADKYGLDYRLVPAIGMQESNLCKKAPEGSNNCWGYGVYGKKVVMFDNYTEAIEAVTRNLALNYKEIGLVTPEQIMKKHTPSSNGSWAFAVNHFMGEMH